MKNVFYAVSLIILFVLMISGRNNYAASVSKPEHNTNDSLPMDSLKIAYGKRVDTIYGFRRGDTLVFERDILFNIPTDGIKGVATKIKLWRKNNGIVKINYVIDDSYANRKIIKEAMDEWTSKTGIQFKETDLYSVSGDYIYFKSSDYTESYVGRKGDGQQVVNLRNDASKGNIMHEIGHCLGLYHEQSRSDRKDFVLIRCPNDPDYRHAFETDDSAVDILAYNLFSIMHYPVDSCMVVIHPNGLPKGIPGQRDSLAASDYNTIKGVYRLK